MFVESKKLHEFSDSWGKIISFYPLIRSPIIWALIFGNYGSTGMPVVPATILMSALDQVPC